MSEYKLVAEQEHHSMGSSHCHLPRYKFPVGQLSSRSDCRDFSVVCASLPLLPYYRGLYSSASVPLSLILPFVPGAVCASPISLSFFHAYFPAQEGPDH